MVIMLKMLLFMFGAVALLAPFFVLMLIIRALQRRGGSIQQSTEENRMVQEIHAQLERMEQRVGSLETILMDRIEKHPLSSSVDR